MVTGDGFSMGGRNATDVMSSRFKVLVVSGPNPDPRYSGTSISDPEGNVLLTVIFDRTQLSDEKLLQPGGLHDEIVGLVDSEGERGAEASSMATRVLAKLEGEDYVVGGKLDSGHMH